MPPPTTGLVAWQDALAISQSDGTAVSQWNDASGNAHHATQATGGSQPIYRLSAASTGFPAVQFDGTDDFLSYTTSGYLASTNNAASMLLCGVVRSTNATAIQQFIASATGAAATNSRISLGIRGSNLWSVAGRRLDADTLQTVSGTGVQTGIGVIITAEIDWANSDARVWVGRALAGESLAFQTSGNSDTTNSLAAAIGARGDGGEPFSGYLFDVYTYSPTLSATDRDALWTFLEGRWGFLRYTDDMGARFRLQPPGLYAPMHARLSPWMGTGVAPAVTAQTIQVAQAVETEVAPQVATPTARAAETEIAQAIGKAKTVAVAQAVETELGQTVTPRGVVAQAVETEIAQAIGKAKTVAVGQAVETEIAQAITVRKTVAVAQAVETELGQAVGKQKTRAAGQAIETELGQAVGKAKRAAVAQTVETELGQTVTSTGHKFIAVGQAVETETGQTFTRVKTRALVQAAEAEAAQALTKRLAYALGQAVEDETGQAILTGLHVSNPPGRIVVGIPGGTVTVLGGGTVVTGSAGGTIILLRSGALFDTFNDVYSDMFTASVGPPGVVHIERPAGILTIGE